MNVHGHGIVRWIEQDHDFDLIRRILKFRPDHHERINLVFCFDRQPNSMKYVFNSANIASSLFVNVYF